MSDAERRAIFRGNAEQIYRFNGALVATSEGSMATNIKQVIYFHRRLDATAETIRSKRSDIDMFRRDFDGPVADTWADMSRAPAAAPTRRATLRVRCGADDCRGGHRRLPRGASSD